MMFLLQYWKLIGIAAAFLASFGGGWYVEGQIAESRQIEALAAQETALIAKCNSDKAITERIDNEQLQKITDLNSRVDQLKRLHKADCVSVTHATGSDHAGTAAGYAGKNDIIDQSEFIDYAAIAEKHRIQLLGCQDFIRSERK